jgi:uncharacterized protein
MKLSPAESGLFVNAGASFGGQSPTKSCQRDIICDPAQRGTGDMKDAPRIDGLEALLKIQGEGQAPVESWNPPYCGDIGMAIKADGTWFYQGSPIGRIALVKLFARVLRREADGKHFLVTPAEKVDVAVDDAPFLAVEMQVDGSGEGQVLTFRTNVDDIVRCGPAHPLRFVEERTGGLKPYVVVRGRLEALVTRALYYDLVELAVSHPIDSERLGIWSDGAWFELAAT